MIKTITAETVHRVIEDKLKRGSSYIDAVVEFAQEQGLEMEQIASIIRRSEILKEKIREEATSLRLVKREPDVTTLF